MNQRQLDLVKDKFFNHCLITMNKQPNLILKFKKPHKPWNNALKF